MAYAPAGINRRCNNCGVRHGAPNPCHRDRDEDDAERDQGAGACACCGRPAPVDYDLCEVCDVCHCDDFPGACDR